MRVAVSWKYKLRMFALFMALYAVMYILPNLHPKFPPSQLPLLSIDYAVPLIPWTFLIYLSDYLFALIAIVLLEGEDFKAFARSAFATLTICGMFFLFYPTTYPRPEYPHVDNLLYHLTMRLIASADTPNNCFPSMHVAITGVAAWNLRHRSPLAVALFTFWALAIFVSTLTTKQHYFLDILGGVTVVLVVATLEVAFEKYALPRWTAKFQGK